MTEEEIMRALSEAAKAKVGAEPSQKWDALTADALSEAERAELLAGDADGELSDLFAPLGTEFEDQLLAKLLPEPTAEPAPPAPAPTPQADQPKAPANTNRWWWVALTPIVALAAALLIMFAWPGPAPLPEFTFEVSGGDQVLRGDPTGPTIDETRMLSAGSTLTVIARPPVATTEALTATVFVRTATGVEKVPAEVDISPAGAMRWTGTAGTPPLTEGVTAVVVVLHRVGTAAQRISDAARTPGDLPVHEVPVRIRP